MVGRNFTTEQKEEMCKLYQEDNFSATKIAKMFNTTANTISSILKDRGVKVINKQNQLKFDLQKDIVPLYESGISLTKLAKQFGTTHHTLSKYLKELGYEIVNQQNKTKFDETVFDSIDTEEKAYWLGFIYADGYIDFSPLEEGKKSRYGFELSLKGSDIDHLHKFNTFMKHNKDNVRIGTTKCNGKECSRCRWFVANKHLWKTLNSYGCTPRKSLILQFPNRTIFKSESLIRHFIRGYFDGDGCISYIKTNPHDDNSNYTCIGNILSTLDFLTSLNDILKSYDIHGVLRKAHKDENVYELRYSQISMRRLLHYLYDDCSIYLNRKYKRAKFFMDNCRSSKELLELLESENGEGCDANTVLTESIAKGDSAVQSIESE